MAGPRGFRRFPMPSSIFSSSSSCRLLDLQKSTVNPLTGKILSEYAGDLKDTTWLSNFTPRHAFSTARSDLINDGNRAGKTYADFSIFKGKAALSASPVPPKFSKTDFGYSKVDKKGVVMLTFMPAVGLRKYDHEKRQLFALSATEVGNLISLGPTESAEFFHDPSMKSSLEGQVKKTLTISPIGDGGGYFFNLSVMNSVQKAAERFSVPVTKAEYAVLRTAFGFALPHIMGWDRIVSLQSMSSGTPGPMKEPQMRPSPDLEWGR